MPLLQEHKLRGELQEEAGQYKVTIIGNQPTGAMPASGVNGATYLALSLASLIFDWSSQRLP